MPTPRPYVPWLPLVGLAALAGGVAGFAVGTLRRVDVGPEVAAAVVPNLAARLAELEAFAAAEKAKPAPAAVADGSVVRAQERQVATVDPELLQRIEALERRLPAAPATASPEASANQEMLSRMIEGVFAADIVTKSAADHQRAIVQASATEAEKLTAWRALRGQPDGWNDAVVATMVQVGLTSPDPAVRADVWRQASTNRTHAALTPALVQALQLDGDARVREEAAETLRAYVAMPGVRQALETSATSDADASVKRQAQNSLRARTER
jgi:hypothetical protein